MQPPASQAYMTWLLLSLSVDTAVFPGTWGAPDDTAALQAVLAGLQFMVCAPRCYCTLPDLEVITELWCLFDKPWPQPSDRVQEPAVFKSAPT